MKRCWVTAALIISAGTGFCLGFRAASAHTTLRQAIHHRIEVAVAARTLDITMELEFHEDASLPERRNMDADGDGSITQAETAHYLSERADTFLKALKLTQADKALELVPLYDPKIDLLKKNRVEACGHVLRLFYFARLAEPVKARDAFEFSENMWPQIEAVRSIEVSGADGQRWGVAQAKEGNTWRIECRATKTSAD